MASAYDIFGGFCIFVVSVQILKNVFPWIYQNFIGPKLIGSQIKLKEMGEWAVITGATDGIGKAYAQALAKKGLNVVLVSRSLNKLEDVAKEIETEYKVQTKVIDVDFTSGPEIYEKIAKQTMGLEIGVLVNNVGMGYANPEYFLKLPDNEKVVKNLVACNILSVTGMCNLIMPQMVDRKRGVVINISSLSAAIPTPLLTVYAATKAFVDKFSDDLATEYSAQGVIIQSVLPGLVATNMSKIKRSSWMACSPATYASSALNTLGIARRTTGYYPHALLLLATKVLEDISSTLAQKITLKTMLNVRARAMKRAEKKSATK